MVRRLAAILAADDVGFPREPIADIAMSAVEGRPDVARRWSDAHCAAIVGDWEEPSGESRIR